MESLLMSLWITPCLWRTDKAFRTDRHTVAICSSFILKRQDKHVGHCFSSAQHLKSITTVFLDGAKDPNATTVQLMIAQGCDAP